MVHRKLIWPGLLAGLGLILLWLGLLRLSIPAGLSRLEAEQLWLRQQPARYQLTVAQQTAMGTCDQESLVDNQTRQATNLSNDCRNPIVWTVPRLFSWIAELEHTQVRCYPTEAMCACRTTLRTSVRYDPAQGFPREVIYEWRKWPNLLSPAYYRSRFDQSFPGCDKDGVGGQVIIAISLTDQP